MAYLRAAAVDAAEPAVRRIGTADLAACLRQGWDDFLAAPTQLLFLGVIYPLAGIVAARAAYGADMLPLIFPLLAGLSIMGPVVAAGIYELSRRRERGEDVRVAHAADVLHRPGVGSIVALGVLLLALLVGWLWAAQAVYDATLGPAAPTSPGAFLTDVFTTAEGWSMILVGNLVGLVFAVCTLCLTVVSFPLLVDRNVGAGVALRTSVRAVARNPVPMALWGLIVAALLALGVATLLVGLAVVMPVLGHATWHLYRRTVAV